MSLSLNVPFDQIGMLVPNLACFEYRKAVCTMVVAAATVKNNNAFSQGLGLGLSLQKLFSWVVGLSIYSREMLLWGIFLP